ncbi:MAG: drug/metabolite transporter (DMT)-like permease [Planctomycetota bacterium]|jgi:drug/metabolite transporter (DMT)-like permease
MPNYIMNARDWGKLVLISIVWGLSFFFIEIALRELGFFTLVFYRIGSAAVIVTMILYIRGGRLPFDLSSWRKFFTLGLFNNFIPFSLITWGQVQIDSGLASILTATTPLFAVVMAHFMTRDEHMTRNRIVGVLLGVVGVCLLVGPEALHGLSSHAMGQIAVLGSAVSYSYGSIYTRELNKIPLIEAMAGTLIAAFILATPAMLLFEYPLQTSMQWTTIGAVLAMAVFGTVFAYMLYFNAVRTFGATNTMLVTFLVPITALLMGVAVLGESLSQYALLGMLVIFAGLLAVDGRVFRKLRA